MYSAHIMFSVLLLCYSRTVWTAWTVRGVTVGSAVCVGGIVTYLPLQCAGVPVDSLRCSMWGCLLLAGCMRFYMRRRPVSSSWSGRTPPPLQLLPWSVWLMPGSWSLAVDSLSTNIT